MEYRQTNAYKRKRNKKTRKKGEQYRYVVAVRFIEKGGKPFAVPGQQVRLPKEVASEAKRRGWVVYK